MNLRRVTEVRFWLQELRTPELILELTRRHPKTSRGFVATRPVLAHALSGRRTELEQALGSEESAERELDRRYWLPLKVELRRGLESPTPALKSH